MKIMIKSIIRPEKINDVMAALMEAGYAAVTRMSVAGRGKQRGIKIGDVTYDEIPKEMLITVVDDTDKDFVIKTIITTAKTGEKGAFGDGKIFVNPVTEIYTISTGVKETGEEEVADTKVADTKGGVMKEIMAIIRMNKINSTKMALLEAGIPSMTAMEALGRGKGLVNMDLLKGAEEGYEEAIAQLGQSDRLIPKRAIFLVVPDKLVKKTVDTIMDVNQTGKSGDGVIWVMPTMDAVSVRTAENGDTVLDDV